MDGQSAQKALADIIIKHTRDKTPLKLPLRIGEKVVGEDAVVDTAITYWRDIARELGIHVYANPIAIVTAQERRWWLVEVYLPHGYTLVIKIGNNAYPKAWLETPEREVMCYCGE